MGSQKQSRKTRDSDLEDFEDMENGDLMVSYFDFYMHDDIMIFCLQERNNDADKRRGKLR